MVIPRTCKIERLSENIDIFDFHLTAEEMKQIRRAGASGRPHCRVGGITGVGLSPDTALVLFSGGRI